MWAYQAVDNPKVKYYVMVKHQGVVTSAIAAIRASIVREYRERESREANKKTR